MTHAPLPVSCQRCSAVLPAGANFCSRCGIGVTRPVLPPRSATPIPTVVQSRAANKPSSCKAWPLIFLAIFGLRAYHAFNRYDTSRPQLNYQPPRAVAPALHSYNLSPRLMEPPPPPPVWQPAVQAPPEMVDDVHWRSHNAWEPHPRGQYVHELEVPRHADGE